MLTDEWALEAHRSRLQGLPVARALLLGLEKTLVSRLADWGIMSPWGGRDRKQNTASTLARFTVPVQTGNTEVLFGLAVQYWFLKKLRSKIFKAGIVLPFSCTRDRRIAESTSV